MKSEFYITPKARKHLLRHFSENTFSGSHFNQHVFNCPEDLVSYLNSDEDKEFCIQYESKNSICFAYTHIESIGTEGIALRNAIGEENIIFSQRDGYNLDIALCEHIPETNIFLVFARKTKIGLSITTAFPGRYSRPFPRKGQSSNEYLLNKKFWKEHVLLKKK